MRFGRQAERWAFDKSTKSSPSAITRKAEYIWPNGSKLIDGGCLQKISSSCLFSQLNRKEARSLAAGGWVEWEVRRWWRVERGEIFTRQIRPAIIFLLSSLIFRSFYPILNNLKYFSFNNNQSLVSRPDLY